MDLNKSLGRIIVSNTRFKLLKLFFSQPRDSFYVREASRLCDEELNSVRRELNNLKKAGVLLSERRGNRLFFSADASFSFFQTILELIAKVSGLGGQLVKSRTKLGEIKFIIFSGRFLRWEENKGEVDFLVVGKAILPEIGSLVVKEEEKRGREINYAVMNLEELKLRKTSRDPFLLNILVNNPVVIYGDEAELAKI
jgi:hypothetical protein